MNSVNEESKQRILSAASRIFAEKGYSGARIDEIAREARVNKALIYYYFKNKEAMLQELLQTFFRESTELLLNFVERGGFAEDAEKNKRLFEDEYERYLEGNADLLRILLTESLKGDVKEPALFRLVDLSGNDQDQRIKGIEDTVKISEKEQRQMLVTEFFTGVMPFVAYVVLKDKWCRHFKISPQELKECFDQAMRETHERYHEKRKGKSW
jgi:AcrR family transcriptional regulator